MTGRSAGEGPRMSLIALSEQVLNGLIISVFYALAALGLAIIFGVLKIVNFAHGELYAIGGFAYYGVASLLGLPPPVAVATACALLFVLAAAALGVALIACVIYLLGRTWAGKAIRAVSQDRETAAVVGVDARLVGMLAFGLGSALAGTAGALMGPVFLVHPTMGVIPAIKAYVIVVLGGMGSVPGAIVGALVLGQVENLATVLIPDTTRALAYKDAYGLVLLVLVLLLRPQGLFGERARRL